MKNVQKLAEKIEALRAELSAAKAAEKTAAAEGARREIERAFKASGLVSLVASGMLSGEVLAREFSALADRAKRPATVENPQE